MDITQLKKTLRKLIHEGCPIVKLHRVVDEKSRNERGFGILFLMYDPITDRQAQATSCITDAELADMSEEILEMKMRHNWSVMKDTYYKGEGKIVVSVPNIVGRA